MLLLLTRKNYPPPGIGGEVWSSYFEKKFMRPGRILLICIFLSLFSLPGYGQLEKQLDSLINRASDHFKAKQYDSSLSYNTKALDLIRANPGNNYLVIFASPVTLNIGKCLKELNDLPKAHKYLTYALQLARASKLNFDIEDAFLELNNLHRMISEQNLVFPYPAVPVTEEVNMYFPVGAVEKIPGDSIRITVHAGRLDGITDSVFKAVLVQRDSMGQKPWPSGMGLNCYVRELGENKIILTATYDTAYPVAARDLLYIKTMVPVSWRKLAIAPLVSNAISFVNNYRIPIYHSRYLYYYADSLTNVDLTRVIKNQVDEVVEQYAKDTATNSKYLVKGDKGIFAGENVMRALSRSNEEHIRLFTGYIKNYPVSYRSNRFKFSETFATWVIYNTPLADEDVRPYLLSLTTPGERQRMSANFSNDIKDRDLVNSWFNDGMLMANVDNIDSAQYISALMKDACIALKDSSRAGWADYLDGYIQKKLGESKKADSSFRVALGRFKASGNKEGETWTINALKNLKSSRDVTVMLQTGHIFQYLMAPSPNSRYLATAGSYDKLVKIWDMIQGRTIHSFSAHDEGINSISYSPNGRYIVTAADDKTIKIWNAYDFSLLRTIDRPKAELSVIFTPDSKQIVAGGQDSLIKFIDINSAAVVKTLKKHRAAVTSLCFLPTNSDYLFSAGRDSMVYKWNLTENDWNHWYSAKGRILQVAISNNGKYMSLVCSDTLIRVWKLENNKFYFNIRPNYSRGENVDIAFPSFSPDGNYLALAYRNDSLDIIDLKALKEKVYRFKTEKNQGMYDMVFSPDGSWLATRMSVGGPLRVFNFSGWDFENNSTVGLKEIQQYANVPLAVQFTNDDKGLAVVHESISKVDLRNGSTTFLYYGAFLFMNNYILMNDERTGIHSDDLFSKLQFYDLVDKKKILELSFPDTTTYEMVRRFELPANNRKIFLGGGNGTLAGYSLPDGKLLFSKKYEGPDEKGISFLRYDSLRQKLYVIQKDDKVLVVDPINGNILSTIIGDRPQSVEVTPLYLYVTCDNSLVYKYDAKTLKLVKKIKVHNSGIDCYGSVMSYDYRYLVVQVSDKFVTLDTRTDKVLYERYDHDYANGTMCISHNNKMLVTGGFDSKIHLYDLVTGNKISTIHTPRGKDFMLVDNKGNYLAPKNTLEAVNFSFNNSSYGFEQFDTRFNRPDIVLKKIGAADSNLINTYAAAWRKRLKKLNLSEKDLAADIHLPVARLKDKFTIKPSTTLKEYELSIECFDVKYPLRTLHVLVNNNPVFGAGGKQIGGQTRRSTQTFSIPLSSGINKVKIYCTNDRGTASLAEYIEINSIYPPGTLIKTYFIGIAVSNYRDSSMNLRFAAKDVRDLTASFGNLYKNFEADTLIDTRATKENILALRSKLMNTTVNDRIIISVNGHGLLDDSLDFYYATYDMDFSKPSARGLKYEDLEALLDGIPARKKLLLIDACHSGALDKEELLAQQKKRAGQPTDKADTVKGFAARGSITRSNKAKTDANSTYEVMQNLFADISSGNGAVIISAAGGMEYAFESDKWNNGVFTYCIRRGIEEEKADKEDGNNDNLVDVGELKEYVSRKVSELTNGKQRPVSRRENIEYNWIIW